MDRNGTASANGQVQIELPDSGLGIPKLLKALRQPRVSELEVGLQRIDAEMDMVRHQGLWGMLRLRWEAWLEEQMKDPAIRKMKARQAILEEQCKTAQAHIQLKTTIQSGECSAERGQIEHNQLVKLRLQSDIEFSGIVLPAIASSSVTDPVGSEHSDYGNSSTPPVEIQITDEQIEALALRAVMTIGNGEGAEEAWQQYRQELYSRLPRYAAQEVEHRVQELRKVAA